MGVVCLKSMLQSICKLFLVGNTNLPWRVTREKCACKSGNASAALVSQKNKRPSLGGTHMCIQT